ncbi:MAG TPA: prolyl oligopeptidase family serine peptidase [Virgibacillus sp.]|nr:prolyl oligopeptidase family serine peptidase [Virgibacillus sp.]HLR67017.1 prolyl oligopeptidase family serine peptidase [Virgibacillus sp.]
MTTKKITTVAFEELNIEVVKEANSGILKVIKEGLDFYFKLNLKLETKNAVVFSNGAFDPNLSKPPVFMRYSWAEDYNATCICIDDRTIHGKNIRLGWGIGTPERHYLLDISAIVMKLLSVIQVNNDNVIYFGSSAGGFMSLMLAVHHKGTKAIVNNPQVYAHKYSTASSTLKTLFPNMDRKDIHRKYGNRLSVTQVMKQHNYVPEILYLLNNGSDSDVNSQYKPFIANVKKHEIDINNVNFWIYNKPEAGHDYISREETAHLLNMYFEKQINIIK